MGDQKRRISKKQLARCLGGLEIQTRRSCLAVAVCLSKSLVFFAKLGFSLRARKLFENSVFVVLHLLRQLGLQSVEKPKGN